jgi:hypothetical protein
MIPVSRQGTAIVQFGGLATNVGPIVSGDAAMTAAVQINLTCVRQGELATRPGLQTIQFDEPDVTVS